MEKENRGIGQITIPQPVWEQMQLAPTVEIELPQTERFKRILETYGKLPLDALKEGVARIEKRFGTENCRRVLRHLDTGDVESAARLLAKYYDKSYTHPELNQPASKGRLYLSRLSPLKRVAKLMKVAEMMA